MKDLRAKRGGVVRNGREAVKGAEAKYSCEMKPTGKALFVLNLFAEASLNNGFRYVKELSCSTTTSTWSGPTGS